MGRTAYRYCLSFLLVALGLVGLPIVATTPVHAQQTQNPANQGASDADDGLADPDPLDPDQPLTEFPDFGVEWPDLDDPEPVPETIPVAPEPTDPAPVDGEAVDSLAEVEDADGDLDFQPEDTLAERGYSIAFSGRPPDLSPRFAERFEALSALREYRDDDANFAQIKRRAETDRELVERLLRIEGHYDAIVRARFDAGEGSDVVVTFAIIAGPQYRLDQVDLPGVEAAAEDDPAAMRTAFGLQSGAVINSDRIVEAQARLDQALAESGYPFAETGEPELVIDHANRDGDLGIVVTPGGRYAFGRIVMDDTSLFDPDHVALIARFEQGDLYRQSDLDDLRRALIATGLVSTLTLEPVAAEEPGVVDLKTTVTPAPLRTISGAIGYGTGEGARSEVSWEHRNFFPPEGLVRLTGVVATQEQSGSVTYRRNNFRRRDNVLNAQVSLSNIDRSAFEARTFSVSANIERQSNLIFQKKWSWSAGIELLASQERDIVGDTGMTERETFFIGALPATLTYDGSDDLLDPTSGFRLSARLSPEASLQSGSFFYVRGQIDASGYVPVSEKIVLAGRARLGSIVGAGSNRIAPSRRLYAGGGGSVRGFGFQRIGPRDVNNDPSGGRSLVEFSLEARIRLDAFGGNFGVVPFLDAGNVYTDSLPDFSGLRYGAGVGLRYYSDFGPIRIDVGTPINPQPGDSRIAVYVSLGQAF